MQTKFSDMVSLISTGGETIELLRQLSVENVERTRLMLDRSARLRADLILLEQSWINNIKQVGE